MTALAALALLAAAPEPAGYEARVVSWGLAQVGARPDPAPEGKRIEAIWVASEDIVAPADPWPALANAVHVKTRELTVRRELLFEVGEPYSADVAAETERNLRSLFILAVARVVAVEGSAPDRVGVVVVTKDLWSIRLDSAYTLVGPLLQYLRIRPSEENFLGRDKTLQLDFRLKLDTLSFGQLYYDPRLWGSRLELLEQADVVVNRASQQLEGSFGTVQVDRPLYSLQTEWGFSVLGQWDIEPTRVYQGAVLWAPFGTIPLVYNARTEGAVAVYTRSFGRYWKTNVSVGLGGHVRKYAPPVDPQWTDAQRAELTQDYLPWSETATYLTAIVGTYEADYRVLRDVDSFALSEDFQMGHSASATLRWSEPAWGSPLHFFEAGVTARYRAFRHDDFFSVQAAATARYMPGVVAAGIAAPWVNQRFAAELRNYFPALGRWGRVVVRALFDERRNDLNHGYDFLGGDLGLRGTAPDVLVGTRELLANVEFRSRPVEFFTVHAGLVLFYDAGSAFDTSPNLVHAVGLGIRALFPQLDIQPVRIDFGYAFNGPVTPFLNQFSSSFGQVTDIRPSFLDAPL